MTVGILGRVMSACFESSKHCNWYCLMSSALLYGPLEMDSFVGFQKPASFLRARPSFSRRASESLSFPSGTFGKILFCTGVKSSVTSIASRIANIALWYQ